MAVQGTFYRTETQRLGVTPVSPPNAVDDPVTPLNPPGSNTDAVTSVFGRLGNILAIEADYQAFYPRLSELYDNPTWINSLLWSKMRGDYRLIVGDTDILADSGLYRRSNTNDGFIWHGRLNSGGEAVQLNLGRENQGTLRWREIASDSGSYSAWKIAVDTTRTLTINGIAQDLSTNRSWTVGNVQGNFTINQIPYADGTNSLAGTSILTWSNATNELRSGRVAFNATESTYVNNIALPLIYNTNGSGAGPFAGSGNLIISSRSNLARSIYFVTNNGTATDYRWEITSGGTLQSNGAQTIQTSTGNLTLATGGGNGNIILTPNGTGQVMIGSGTPTNTVDVNGTARIRSVSNATGNFVTLSATGVLQHRTAAEVVTDLGVGLWTTVGSDIYRNSAVAIGRTTIPTNATFAVQSLTAVSTNKFIQFLNNSGTEVMALTQGGGLTVSNNIAVNNTIDTSIAAIFKSTTDTDATAAIRTNNASGTLTFQVTGLGIRSAVRHGFGGSTGYSDAAATFRTFPLSTNFSIFIENFSGTRTVAVPNSGAWQSLAGAFFGSSNIGIAPTARVDIRGVGTTTGLTLILEDSAGTNNAEFVDNGNIRFLRLPTSSSGLPAGSLWNNGGVLNIV